MNHHYYFSDPVYSEAIALTGMTIAKVASVTMSVVAILAVVIMVLTCANCRKGQISDEPMGK